MTKDGAKFLEKKQKEFGTDIYLISDEPVLESWHMTEWKFLSDEVLCEYDRWDILYSKSLSLRENESELSCDPNEAADSEI